MKKSLLALTLTAALFSCKKDIEQKSLEAKDISGQGWVKGNLTKTIITPNGTGGWTNNTRIPAANVNITVRVATNGVDGIYPNSNYASTEVFTGSTDANGNYAIGVKSNGTGTGVLASIFVEGFTSTQDTVINGTTKVGKWYAYLGSSSPAGTRVWKGQTTWWNPTPWSNGGGNMSLIADITNPTTPNIGSAIITGSIAHSFVRSASTNNNGTVTTSPPTSTDVPVPDGTKVWYTFDVDPLTLSTRVYQTTTSAGNYTFNVTTVAAGTNGFNQNGTVWLSDLTGTRDTVKCLTTITGTVVGVQTTATPFTTGKAGVWNAAGITSNQNGLFNNEVRNAVNLTYNQASFTAN
jgi:hypothetical protein